MARQNLIHDRAMRGPSVIAFLGLTLLCGCSSRLSDPALGVSAVVPGVDFVRVIATANEPEGDFDLPVAAGQIVAAIGERVQSRPSDLPHDARTIKLVVRGLSLDVRGDQRPTTWAVMILPLRSLNEQRFGHMDPQAALELVAAIRFASPAAWRTARIYCGDPVRQNMNPTFCRQVSTAQAPPSGKATT